MTALRILTFSTLFPSAARPAHGVFVEERLRHLVESGDVQASVVAPVPWFPSRDPRFGEYASFASTPRAETRHGLRVLHPRYVLPPKVGMTVAPWLLALGALPAVRQLVREEGDFDVLDSHYLYPDGVAASLIARWLGKPFTMTARGTDVTLVPRHALPRRMILSAAKAASQIVTVCEALRRDLVALGVDEERVIALLNGVDLAKFRPLEREACRSALGFEGRTLLSVGLLIERKGHDLAIGALRELPDTRLVIAGSGPLEGALKQLAAGAGVADRVRFAGPVAHGDLALYYSAADALVLASSREGLANVLLESIACGNPVVATDVNGTAEVVRDPAAGVLVRERSASGIAAAVRELFSRYPDRAATRRHAQAFGWEATTRGQLAMFHAALGRRQVLA
jgi:teichuronic acid biosynthesis glycosyltransferase TuaC